MSGLSARVRQFLSRDVDSLEALEVLLLLRQDPERGRSLDDIVQELRSSPFAIRRRIDILVSRKFVVADGDAWRYSAAPKADAIIAEAALAYDRQRARVIDAIHGSSKDPLRAFASAFRLKDEVEDDR